MARRWRWREQIPSFWLARRVSTRGHGARWGTRCEELASIVVRGPKSFSWPNSSAMLSQSTKQSPGLLVFKPCSFQILVPLFCHPLPAVSAVCAHDGRCYRSGPPVQPLWLQSSFCANCSETADHPASSPSGVAIPSCFDSFTAVPKAATALTAGGFFKV